MTSDPTDRDNNSDFDEKPLQVSMKPLSTQFLYPLTLRTLRVWATEPCDDIMTYIWSKGLGDTVLEAVPLEEIRSAADGRVPDGLPKNSILVGLAEVGREMDRFRHYSIHKRYLQ